MARLVAHAGRKAVFTVNSRGQQQNAGRCGLRHGLRVVSAQVLEPQLVVRRYSASSEWGEVKTQLSLSAAFKTA